MAHQPDVLAEVTGMLGEVIGHDLLPVLRVGRDTTFAGDLALESIEFVALADRVRRRYGDLVDLPGFFAGMDLDRLAALTVGDLVDHVERRLAAAHA
ncbi:acyl carrier protein [Thermomonospora echinospora]|uniref:Acyl carrier protein n=1 Tax=Thermomonospora echinospora TaxID=1992 RepID=A0A1H5XP15_9ACTN|nr:phosphopantetheine-binding protein [Thermomonospora echinospora]SEG12996.1 acyl carrier protein [Thermomonospora echinospora]